MKKLSLGMLCLGMLVSSAPAEPIAPSLKDNLVVLNGAQVAKFDGTPLASTKYFALFFGAAWSAPCRKFTPDLVKWYTTNRSKHPEIEVIFVSNDHDQATMEAYMKVNKMPWPTVAFDQTRSANLIQQYSVGGMPCLVLVDADGKVLSHSIEGSTYVGPQKVMKDIDKMLGIVATSTPAPATATRPTRSVGTGSSFGTTGIGTGSGVGVGGSGTKPASPQGSNFDEFFKKK